jgi:DNA-binding transcriptional regulator YhcF (GntR family)
LASQLLALENGELTVGDQTPEQREVMPDSDDSLNLDHLGTLNPDGDEAASRQIANQIRTAIATGRLGIGEMLPSQARLASHYGVARETTKAALAQLRNEGLVQSWQGKGTFVRGARTAEEQQLWAELVEIQEKVHRLKREFATLDRALTDLIRRLPENGQYPCPVGQERAEAAVTERRR